MPWNAAFKRLTKFAQTHPCVPPEPPIPLILAGWVYSNDIDKMRRWEQTIEWAAKNGCPHLLSNIRETDFYLSKNPTTYTVGPMGGPMYRTWDYGTKDPPSAEVIAQCMATLLARWSEIAGERLAGMTRPLAFTGDKGRRLLVRADGAAAPPWGGWSHLSEEESERRTFTDFRTAINKAIVPHEVDHVDFTTERESE